MLGECSGSSPMGRFLFWFLGGTAAAGALHLSQQVGLIEVHSLRDELFRFLVEEVIRGYVYADGVRARLDSHVFAQVGAGQLSLAHSAAGEIVLRPDFDVKVREGLANRIVEGPDAADAFESSRNQKHVAKGRSRLGESLAGGVPVVGIFRRDVGGYNAVLTFHLLFQSHGWGLLRASSIYSIVPIRVSIAVAAHRVTVREGTHFNF
jgi:hypothetical protein